eukprot:scaffold66004_cov64-Phaeocystis_antarctica.AAC.5
MREYRVVPQCQRVLALSVLQSLSDPETENKLAAYTTRAQQPTSLGTPTLGLYQPQGAPRRSAPPPTPPTRTEGCGGFREGLFMGSPPGPVAGGAPRVCGAAPPRTSPMSRRRASPLAPRRRTRPSAVAQR